MKLSLENRFAYRDERNFEYFDNLFGNIISPLLNILLSFHISLKIEFFEFFEQLFSLFMVKLNISVSISL